MLKRWGARHVLAVHLKIFRHWDLECLYLSILQEQYHDKLNHEGKGELFSSISNVSKEKSAEDTGVGEEILLDLQQVAGDAANMSEVLMSRKRWGLYNAIQIAMNGHRWVGSWLGNNP